MRSWTSDRALTALSGVALAVVVLLTAQAHRVLLATWDHSAIRLLRSAALLDGTALYPPAGSGWITASMYGPVSAFAYLPAFLAPGPEAAIAAGQGLSTAFYLLGIVAVLLAAPPGCRAVPTTLAALAMAAATTLDLWALRYPALTIHADAPTLCLGALAIAGHLRRRHPATAHLAACAAILAVWSKQVAIGVPIALILHALWADGWREGARTAARLAIWAAAVGGLFVVVFGPLDAMVYHLVTVPGQQPWNWGGGLGALGRSFWLMVSENQALVGLGVLLPLIAKRSRAAPWTVPALVAVVSLPFALLGRAKVAGDVNAFSHSLFFVLLAVVVGLRDAGAAHDPGAHRGRLARLLLVVVPWVSLSAILLTERDRVLTLPDYRVPYAAIERYVERHPDRVYLPRLGLVTWYVERRLDHQAPGLSDHRVAGIPLGRHHLFSGLPPDVDRVVFFDNPWSDQWRLLPDLNLRPLPADPALPDCLIFEARP